MPFVIIWSDQSQKELSKLERDVAARKVNKLEYANSAGLLKLEKVEGKPYFKYRVGDYRAFIDKQLADAIEVIHIEHRKKAYKK